MMEGCRNCCDIYLTRTQKGSLLSAVLMVVLGILAVTIMKGTVSYAVGGAALGLFIIALAISYYLRNTDLIKVGNLYILKNVYSLNIGMLEQLKNANVVVPDADLLMELYNFCKDGPDHVGEYHKTLFNALQLVTEKGNKYEITEQRRQIVLNSLKPNKETGKWEIVDLSKATTLSKKGN